MHIFLTFWNKLQSCFCYLERYINALLCIKILKFVASVAFKLLLKNYRGLYKPCVEGSIP